MDALRQRGPMSINDLARELSVSHMTVRRDIEHLVGEGGVNRYHGGVRLSDAAARSPYDLRSAEFLHRHEKEAIAQRALSLIQPGDILFLDAGTTTGLIAEGLPTNFNLTVISSAFNVINITVNTPGVQVIAAGGAFHKGSGVFEGPEGVSLLERMRITKSFISARAVDLKLGVTCSNMYEVVGKQAAMRSSLAKILVSDSSKLGHVASAHFSELDAFDRVIMDLPDDPALQRVCRISSLPFDFVMRG